MKFLKSLFVILTLTLSFPNAALAGEQIYSDGSFSEAIYWTHEWGIFNGYPDGSFHSSNEMNRAELAKVLVLGSGVEEDDVSTCAEEATQSFSDVPTDEWYTDYVYCAKAKGWVSGDDGADTFRPGDPVLMGETFKMIVESQYGTPDDSYKGTNWYNLYTNFLDDYQVIEEYHSEYSSYVYYVYTFLELGYDDGLVGFDSSSLASKMQRQDIAELLYRMRIVFDENSGAPYDPVYTFDELEELYGTEIEIGDALSVADPHFGFRFENVPLEKLNVDPEDWRVYISDPSAFEHGGYSSWGLFYLNGEKVGYYSGYDRFFSIGIYDANYSTSQHDVENENGQKYLWWCPPGYGTTVEEILASECVVDAEQNVDADYVNFGTY
ncbi:MAG: S-layer homology domain-containing protein [Candidatus Gracilibacteria bacterium]